LPSCHGDHYLHLQAGGGKLITTVYLTGDARPLLRLPDLDVAAPQEGGWNDVRELPLDKRVHFIPRAKVIITVPPTNDRLVVRRFDVDEALEKAGIDYLLVTSRPPPSAVKGGVFTYQLAVKSKRGGVKCWLELGPDGMKVSSAGRVTWPVPADHEAGEYDAVVGVSDRTGQELFHAFKVSVQP
jgi:hypothetical protein